jgi:hypothetical protein
MALTFPSTVSRPRMLPLACVAALASVVLIPGATAPAQAAPGGASGAKPSASATLEQCVTAVNQTERSATFAGEMTAIAGSARMEMRIDVLERMPEEIRFHAVSAPGLGVWRSSSQGVKLYKYLKQVTNLSAPAFYRAAVRFRWLNARGRVVKAVELRTARCQQPATPAVFAPTAITSTP